MPRHLPIASWLLAVVLFLVAAPGQAQEELDDASRATVRRLADEGGKLYQDGQYAAALEKLQRAYAIYPAPSIGYYSARCLEALGRWVEASERYVEVTRLEVPSTAAEVHRKAQADAIEARDKLLPRIPKLQINVKGATPGDVVIKIDDVTLKPAQVGLPRPADPGEHVIVADRWGDILERRAILEEGGLRSVDLVFEKREPPPPPRPVSSSPSSFDIASFVLMGVGGAGLLTGAVTGSILLVEDARLADECSVDRCSAVSDVGLANAMRLPTTITLAAGGALFATGLLMYYLGPDAPEASTGGEARPDDVSVMPSVGPGYVGLAGTF